MIIIILSLFREATPHISLSISHGDLLWLDWWVAIKPHPLVSKIRPIGGVGGYKATTDPRCSSSSYFLWSSQSLGLDSIWFTTSKGTTYVLMMASWGVTRKSSHWENRRLMDFPDHITTWGRPSLSRGHISGQIYRKRSRSIKHWGNALGNTLRYYYILRKPIRRKTSALEIRATVIWGLIWIIHRRWAAHFREARFQRRYIWLGGQPKLIGKDGGIATRFTTFRLVRRFPDRTKFHRNFHDLFLRVKDRAEKWTILITFLTTFYRDYHF
jgi:hypothetical protein